MIDRANLRARLEECERSEQHNAVHWTEQARKIRGRLSLYGGGAREELEIAAVEHDVSAAVAVAKAYGLRLALDGLNVAPARVA